MHGCTVSDNSIQTRTQPYPPNLYKMHFISVCDVGGFWSINACYKMLYLFRSLQFKKEFTVSLHDANLAPNLRCTDDSGEKLSSLGLTITLSQSIKTVQTVHQAFSRLTIILFLRIYKSMFIDWTHFIFDQYFKQQCHSQESCSISWGSTGQQGFGLCSTLNVCDREKSLEIWRPPLEQNMILSCDTVIESFDQK